MNTTGPINKPVKTLISLADALRLANDPAFQATQKLDGVFATRVFGDSLLAGERIGEQFFAFDCLQFHGRDCRRERLRERWEMTVQIANAFETQCHLVASGGSLFVQTLLDGGKEGACLKRWDAPYGEMFAVKRSQDFICRVAGTGGGKQSVAIVDAASGADRGRVALFGGKADHVRVGSTLKITGYGLTDRGMIREPRPCSDTATSWLVQF